MNKTRNAAGNFHSPKPLKVVKPRAKAEPVRDFAAVNAAPQDLSIFPASDVLEGALSQLGGPLSKGIRYSIGNLVHQRLRTVILNAQVLPGASISETELAGHLQVSRTPVREAMQKLEAEGLVQVVPQVGTFVTRLNLARIREALFVREAVECAAMMHLPMPLEASSVSYLREMVARHLVAAEQRDVVNVLLSDDEFHKYLLELSGVPGVWRYVLDARETHRRIRVLAQTEFDSARRSASQHTEMIDFLAAGKPEKAVKIMREHIRMNEQFAVDIARTRPDYFINGEQGILHESRR
jgi:DNA-binding GntR family transcriptional regulator